MGISQKFGLCIPRQTSHHKIISDENLIVEIQNINIILNKFWNKYNVLH